MNGAPYARGGTDGDLLVVFNADDAPVDMTLPAAAAGRRLARGVRHRRERRTRGEAAARAWLALPRSTVLLESQAA